MTKQNFKILLAGGGTGGHIFSGIAVAEEVRRSFPDSKILFVGTHYGLEKDLVTRANFAIETIQVSPLKGSGLVLKLKSLMQLPRAYLQSKKMIKDFKPDMVIGIGGYASGPVTLAAHFSNIFTAIIEQNAYPGLTNRILGRFVDKVFVCFEKAKDFFASSKVILSGNPIRDLQVTSPHVQVNKKFCILIVGGSQGAHSINQAMMASLEFLKPRRVEIEFIHQTGKNDLQEVRLAYERGGIASKVGDFFHDMGSLYTRAGLVICRSGAGTLTELKLYGLPSILIPYPFAADNHQYYNAKELEEAHAAEMIPNELLTGQKIAERILFYMDHPEILARMSAAARGLAKPDAAKEVLKVCLDSVDSIL